MAKRVLKTSGDFVASAGKATARLTPLHDRVSPKGGLRLVERGFLGKLTIRADIGNKRIASAIAKVCGLKVPSVCSFHGRGDKRLIWIGPDELLFYCSASRVAEYRRALERGLRNVHASVVEVSDYYTVLSLSGVGSVDLLNSECVLDLRLKSFPVGSAGGTVYGHAGILLQRLSVDSFDIQVRYSFAEYVWGHLADGLKFL